ncbi:hypothetical protein K4K59_001436 [Colletotrichum sp. SAR11_240]|nr:hypothetical protein K4K59_001436 [Colletotrichum sp. SAR11_240]
MLENLYAEAKKVKEDPSLSSKNGEKDSKIEDPISKQDASNEEDFGPDAQNSAAKKMYTDIDEHDFDGNPPPPVFAGKSDLEDHQLFTGDNWDRHSKEELEEAYRDFSALVNFIDKFVSPLRKALREVNDMPVHFNELWHLYTPGSMVYVKDPSVPQKLWRVIQGTGGAWSPLQRPTPDSHLDYLRLGGVFGGTRIIPFTLDCYYVDFNGTNFVRVVKKFDIEAFKDPTSVKSLPILPLRVAENEGLIKTQHIHQRASAFVFFTQFRTPRELSVPYRDAGSTGPAVDDDRVWDLRMAERVLNYTDQSQTLEWDSRVPPTGDEMLLLPGRVFAYVLRTRKWACLPLGQGDPELEENSLTTMESEPSAWDNLQIDYNHRSIIQSMMATHFRKKKSERRQFDLIQDKGKGLIVLLHGVPGVGKTSTAETVAQYYNKPLLPITCGDLGMTPAEVESNLQSSFQLAQAWDCVLLLDEADVFLAERSQDNIARNALVSVFLRVMEYYEGILFLTTNKVGSFDEAFKSRMSLALYYPPLTQDQTEKIWEVQMRRTEKLSKEAAPDDESQHVKFNRLDILALAKELWMMQQSRADWKPVWNGRQIRNAFQTAVALAEWHQQDKNIAGPIDVKREHFEKVAFVSNEFNAYLYTTSSIGRPRSRGVV